MNVNRKIIPQNRNDDDDLKKASAYASNLFFSKYFQWLLS